MRSELEYQWDIFEDQVKSDFADMFDSGHELLKSLQAKVQDAAAGSPYVEALVQGIDSKIQKLKYKLRVEKRALLHRVR